MRHPFCSLAAQPPRLGVADLAIAATAEEVDGTVATRNLKHFPMFADLRAPY